jgi:hypothetical protein
MQLIQEAAGVQPPKGPLGFPPAPPTHFCVLSWRVSHILKQRIAILISYLFALLAVELTELNDYFKVLSASI